MHWKSSSIKKLTRALAPFANSGAQFQLETDSDVYRGEITGITVCPLTGRVGVSMSWLVKLEIQYVGDLEQKHFVGHEPASNHLPPLRYLEFTFDLFYVQKDRGGRVKVTPKKEESISLNGDSLTSYGETVRFLPANSRARLVRNGDSSLVSICTVSEYLKECVMPRSFHHR